MRLLLAGHGRSGTTPTQRIINGCRNLWVTNEFCLYDYAFGYHPKGIDITDPLNYYNSLVCDKANVSNIGHYTYIDPPPNFEIAAFVQNCMYNYAFDDIELRINAVEKVLFGEKYKWFGDKTVFQEVIEDMYLAGIPYKLIFIIRDGRDNVASRIKANFKTMSGLTRDYVWAKYIFDWIEFKKKLNEDDFIELRFEDFQTELNVCKIVDFLGLDIKELLQSQKNNFNAERAHPGHYKKYVPDWEKTFCSEAKEALNILGYI